MRRLAMKRKLTAIIMVSIMTMGLALSGCGNEEQTGTQENISDKIEQSVPEELQTEQIPDNANNEPVKITFWHAMNTDVITNLVNKFNESQEDVYVECIYQGSYGDVLNASLL